MRHSETSYEITELECEHLGDASTLHMAAFPTSALTRLGAEAVRRYYEWLLLGPHHTTALGVYSNKKLVAFLFGGAFNGALTGFLQRNVRFLAKQVVMHPRLLAGSQFRSRIASAVRLLGKRKAKVPVDLAAPPAFGVLAIAVQPEWQGTGAGRVILSRTEEIARAKGFTRMELTVAGSNEKAIAFYVRNGWEKIARNGVWDGLMRKVIG